MSTNCPAKSLVPSLSGFQPLMLLISLGFIWGSGYVIAKYAVTHGVTSLGYSFWQSLGPALVLNLVLLSRGEHLSLRHTKFYFVSGLLGIAIPNTNMYFAAPHLPAGILAVVVNTVPLIVYPLALSLRAEKFDVVRLLGVCLGILGLMLLVLPTASLPEPSMVKWVLLSLLTPLSFAACALYTSICRPAATDGITLSAGMLTASAVLLLPLVLVSGQFYRLVPPFNLVDGVVLLEIMLSSLGYIVFFRLLKLAGPVYYSLVSCVVALTGLFWGWLLFHEQLNQLTACVVLLLVTAILIVGMRQSTNKAGQ